VDMLLPFPHTVPPPLMVTFVWATDRDLDDGLGEDELLRWTRRVGRGQRSPVITC